MNDKLIKQLTDLAALHEKVAEGLGDWPPSVATTKKLHAATGKLLRRVVVMFQIFKRQDDALKATEHALALCKERWENLTDDFNKQSARAWKLKRQRERGEHLLYLASELLKEPPSNRGYIHRRDVFLKDVKDNFLLTKKEDGLE